VDQFARPVAIDRSQPWIRPSNATKRANTEPGTRPNGASIIRSMAPGALTEPSKPFIAARNAAAGTSPGDRGLVADAVVSSPDSSPRNAGTNAAAPPIM